MPDSMIRALVLAVLLVCAVDARADGTHFDVAPDSYTRAGAAGDGEASQHVALRDGHCAAWTDAAAPIRTAPITTRSLALPAGALVENDSGLRIGARGATQLLRTPRDSGGARCQWAPQTVQLSCRLRHQPLFSLPSPLLLAGLQTWATATPPPLHHC